MVKKLKIVTVIGTRPEAIRLSRVIYELEKFTNHFLVHTGQNYDYELNGIFFDELQIKKPNYILNVSSSSSSETIGKVIIETHKLFAELSPDALLILGDTNSCLCAIPAKRLKIPIFHMEAGNRCFDLRVPEEINRRIIDHISDVNLTYSTIARNYLISEGLAPDLVIKTGSPMFEVLSFYQNKIILSQILNSLNIQAKGYFLVSAHREENIDSDINFYKFINILNVLAETYNLPVLLSAHPRTKKRIDSTSARLHSLIMLLKPLGFFDYNKLQISAKVVLSDSGTISEESSILNFPALNIRESHERPEAMEEASVMMVGLEEDNILQAIEMLNEQSYDIENRLFHIVNDYKNDNVSAKVVRIIHSYVDYVNRVNWKKY